TATTAATGSPRARRRCRSATSRGACSGLATARPASAVNDTDELAELLAHALGRQIADLRRLSAGASRETWSFTADGAPRILQRLPRGGTRASVGLEVTILRAAAEAGVPVSRVIASFEAGGPLGMPSIVLEAAPGEALPQRLKRDPRYA